MHVYGEANKTHRGMSDPNGNKSIFWYRHVADKTHRGMGMAQMALKAWSVTYRGADRIQTGMPSTIGNKRMLRYIHARVRGG